MKNKTAGLVFLVFVCLFAQSLGFAQVSIPADSIRNDSMQAFTVEDFLVQVVAHHPVARQAHLFTDRAKGEIRVARSVLDPTIGSKFYRKELDGKNYFTLWDNSLRVPLWYGVDVKAGFERNSGINVNGENITPGPGLSYIGLSLPLGQGLIIDERRATIRQALLLTGMAEAEKVKVINKLLLAASKDYWDWMYTYYKWQLHRQGYDLAFFRFNAIKERVLQGDVASIDSVEAKIEVQNRQVMAGQSGVEYQNTTLILSNYLWREDNTPLEITGNIVPALQGAELTPIASDSLERLLNFARSNHPELIKLNLKLKQLDIERRFTLDKFKPKINLEYNLLSQGVSFNNEVVNGNYLSDNYKFGVSFSYPLFLRGERGKLQLTRLKMSETSLETLQANREIINIINSVYNEWLNLEEQIRVHEQIVENSRLLRDGEEERFDNGESSVFLINTREMSLISNQVKLVELQSKYAKIKATLQWAAGSLIVR